MLLIHLFVVEKKLIGFNSFGFSQYTSYDFRNKKCEFIVALDGTVLSEIHS